MRCNSVTQHLAEHRPRGGRRRRRCNPQKQLDNKHSPPRPSPNKRPKMPKHKLRKYSRVMCVNIVRRIRPNFGQLGKSLAETSPDLSKSGQKSSNVVPNWSNFGRFWRPARDKSSTNDPEKFLSKFHAPAANFDQSLAKSGQRWSNLGQLWSHLAKFGQTRPKFAKTWRPICETYSKQAPGGYFGGNS